MQLLHSVRLIKFEMEGILGPLEGKYNLQELTIRCQGFQLCHNTRKARTSLRMVMTRLRPNSPQAQGEVLVKQSNLVFQCSL